MSIITLTTDYGLKDHFVAALKGKIYSEYPEATVIDISHNIDPFNTVEASYIIHAAYANFPKGSVHIIGVDAELTRENQHVALQWNDHFFVCADNGILSILIQKIVPQKIVSISIHSQMHTEASDLDVFIRVGCHLAKGGSLSIVGKEITTLKQVTQLQPVVSADKQFIKGYVIYIDHFGNIVTNITKALFHEVGNGRNFEIPLFQSTANQPLTNRKNSLPIKSIENKYSDIAKNDNYNLKNYEGSKLALFNEAGFLEIALFRSNPSKVGSASSLLGINYQDAIQVNFIS
jgi:S-adenosylmethionine hydrolase